MKGKPHFMSEIEQEQPKTYWKITQNNQRKTLVYVSGCKSNTITNLSKVIDLLGIYQSTITKLEKLTPEQYHQAKTTKPEDDSLLETYPFY